VNKTYFFISDIHLGLDSREVEREKEKLLVKFLQFAKTECDELFIVGDLFDYWFEYKHVIQKGYIRTFAALSELIDAGVTVHYIIGNHDFLHRDFFGKEIGAKLYHETIDMVLNGKKFLIDHGDGMVKNDVGYKILKKIFRNKFLQSIYSLIHPDLGIKLASHTSKTSRSYTSNKNYGTIDGLLETAMQKIESGYEYVLFGHSHQRALDKIGNGYYINLGSWLDKPCYGKFTETFKIIDWN
jgi:UDP-2,3-diacylglucosamine hydrolase